MRGSLSAQRGSVGMAGPAWPPGPSTENGAGRGREARPSLLGRWRLQSDHCKRDFINYKRTGSPEML